MNERAVVKPTVVDVDELLPPLAPRPSTAEHAAAVLRGQIAQGRRPPGTRQREEHVVESFAISRNTVREAFRLLAHDGHARRARACVLDDLDVVVTVEARAGLVAWRLGPARAAARAGPAAAR